MPKPETLDTEDAGTGGRPGQSRPIARLMDRFSNLPFDELTRRRRELEAFRKGPGIGPNEWYELHAVKALITRYEAEELLRRVESVEK